MPLGIPYHRNMLELPEKRTSENVKEYIRKCLLQNIVSCRLYPGEQIYDDKLSEAFAVSRTPVREVLIELKEHKLIDIRSKRGTFVSLIDPDLVEEIRHLRAVLEEEIAAAACSSFDENDIRDIRENVELWKDAIARQDQQKIMELDKSFHRILYLRAGFPNWYDLVESYAPHFDRTASLSFRLLPKDHILSDHMALADAIASGNAADARRIARRHMERYCENIGEIRKIYPDYFLS